MLPVLLRKLSIVNMFGCVAVVHLKTKETSWIFIYLLGFILCNPELKLRGMELQEKDDKDEKVIRKLIRKSPKKKVSNSRLKIIYIIGQRKAFCKQKFP